MIGDFAMKTKQKLTKISFLSSLVPLPMITPSGQPQLSLGVITLRSVIWAVPLSIILYYLIQRTKLKFILLNKKTKYFIFLFFTVVYSSFALIRHYSFKSNGQDLGVYIQTVHKLGHSKIPELTNWYDTVHPFAVHFEPILYFFVPFEYLGILPPVLLVAQVLGVTLGILGLFKIAKHLKLNSLIPALVSIAYGFSPALQHGIYFDFHTTMLMPSFIIFLFYFILKNDTKKALLLTLPFLLIKEDTAIYTLFFGIYAFWSIRNVKLASSLMLLGGSYGALAVGKIIPTLGKGKITNFVFDRLGNSLPEAVRTSLTKPFYTIKAFFSPLKEKIPVLISTLLHGGLLPLWGYKELLLVVPMFTMRFFTQHQRMWGFSMYYAAPTIAVIAVATLTGYKNLSNQKDKINLGLLSLCYGAAFSFLLGIMPQIPGYYSSSIYRGYFKPNFFKALTSNETKSIRETLKLVPKDASICASQSISPHVSMHSRTTFLGSSVCDNTYNYVLINQNINNWPLSKEEVAEIIKNLKANQEYSVIYSKEKTILFSKDLLKKY